LKSAFASINQHIGIDEWPNPNCFLDADNPEVIQGQKSAFGKFAESDTDECLKADKSQGRFRHIIDF